jgi:CheY-like chemotaxis protein
MIHMTSFALFKRPSRLVFLDDDSLFLDVLSVTLPEQWRADFYMQVGSCVTNLISNAKAWQADFWMQQSITSQIQNDGNFIPLVLRYWKNNTARYDLVQTAVFDYSMPSIDGLSALKMLGNWPGQRLLLTGQADEHIAVHAFNEGLIDQFVLKQKIGAGASLPELMQPLLNRPLTELQVLWQSTLSESQQQRLSQIPVIHALEQLICSKKWVEYVVTNIPFGVLGIDASGEVSWLQLEVRADLVELSELAAEDGAKASDLQSIINGQVLPNTELRLALNSESEHNSLPFSTAGTIELTPDLLAAWHKLGDEYNLTPEQSYDHWWKTSPNRVIKD